MVILVLIQAKRDEVPLKVKGLSVFFTIFSPGRWSKNSRVSGGKNWNLFSQLLVNVPFNIEKSIIKSIAIE
jgi:hypothetical protein